MLTFVEAALQLEDDAVLAAVGDPAAARPPVIVRAPSGVDGLIVG